MRRPSTPPRLLTLILLTGFSPLSLNMFVPSLANIATDLATDYSTVSISISGYLAITAVIQLVIGPLSDRVGRRPVLIVAILIFACASVGCLLAKDIWTFLCFRMLQGGMAAGYTLSMTIVRDIKSERQAASLIGYIGMSMAVAPMLGPMLGGLLDEYFGWRANFLFYSVSGFMLFAICWFDLGETGFLVEKSTDTKSLNPLILTKEPLFWAFSLCGAFSTAAFYIFLAGVPLVAAVSFDVETAKLGFYLGTITMGFMFGGFLAGKYAQTYDITTLMLAGRVVACIGLVLGLIFLTVGIASPQVFFTCTAFVGIGNGMTMPGSNTGAMSVRKELSGSAAGLNSSLIVASGAVMTALTGAILTEENGAKTLLFLMLFTACCGLSLAIWARFLRTRSANWK